MKYVRFLKDYWSFRKGDEVSVNELTRGRAHLIVGRGFGEEFEKTSEKPKPAGEWKTRKKPKRIKQVEPERAILAPEETREIVRPPTEDSAND